MKTYKIVVNGRVQGVGFRAYIQQGAKKHALKGTVRNQADGSVEIILQGSEQDLAVVKQMLASPPHAFMKVKHTDIDEIPSQNDYSSFNIIY